MAFAEYLGRLAIALATDLQLESRDDMNYKPMPSGNAEQHPADKTDSLTDDEVQEKLDNGDSEKIDSVLDDLDVTDSPEDKDQADKPAT
ncbi:hypothetical protein YK56LOC_17510 [Caballeronia sp. HLA56]